MKEISLEYLDRKNYRPEINVKVNTIEESTLSYNHDVEIEILKRMDDTLLLHELEKREIDYDEVNEVYTVLGYHRYNEVRVWDALESLTTARKEVVVDIIVNLYKQQLLEVSNDNNK